MYVCTHNSMIDFGPTDFALFKGKVVEFRMTKRTVILGRSTSCNDVDFDLSLEGPAFKISRRQVSVIEDFVSSCCNSCLSRHCHARLASS